MIAGDSEEVIAVASDEVFAGASEELFADSVDVFVADSDSVALDTVDPLDTVLEVPDYVELVADSVLEVPDSVEEAPDDDSVVHCPRCKTFHAGGVSGKDEGTK